ncbi:hypothetical protein BJV78DRAFT_435232 [Lactifluus subvellereus]|nr:hypothetical protein BJV78DRAFT_435232 [Lactifluus subvellereus]
MSSPHSSAAVSVPGVNVSGSTGVSGNVARDRTLPDILTYRLGSEMVYVTLGETYEQAVDFAVEAFPALRDVDRDLICLEVSVVTRGSSSSEPKTVRIGKRAWPVVVAALKRFEIVELRVAPTPQASIGPRFI